MRILALNLHPGTLPALCPPWLPERSPTPRAQVIKGVADGSLAYDFVEVMACPGGCIGGGGQPRSTDKQIIQKRQAAMYDLDERSTLRRSHENPQIQKLYEVRPHSVWACAVG